jgi:hypothetical protein
MSGVLADAFSAPTAIFAVAGLTFLSGLVVASIMAESRPAFTDSSAAVYSRNPSSG